MTIAPFDIFEINTVQGKTYYTFELSEKLLICFDTIHDLMSCDFAESRLKKHTFVATFYMVTAKLIYVKGDAMNS